MKLIVILDQFNQFSSILFGTTTINKGNKALLYSTHVSMQTRATIFKLLK